MMSEQQKIRHALRRFGFGAVGNWEIQQFAGKSYEAALDIILKTDAPDICHPFRFSFQKDEEADVNTGRFRAWWFLHMLCAKNPFREKLALFWHDHFAVADSKVEFGPGMLEYVQELRKDPAGNFGDILERMVKNPAFMSMLDVHLTRKDKPNENFGRELLELYTLGEGHYQEKDVKEVARCFTGWNIELNYYKFEGKNDDKLKIMMVSGMPSAAYSWQPANADTGSKTVLGKTGDFKGEDVLKMLAVHPETSKHICGKLWSFFGYKKPYNGVINVMNDTWKRTNGNIREVLKTMATHDDFFHPVVQKGLVKSPIDYCVGLCRSMNAGNVVLGSIKKSAVPTDPIERLAIDNSGAVAYWAEVIGQDLLNPPDVDGWQWHEGWVSTDSMIRRRNFKGVMTWEPYKKNDKGEDEWRPGPPIRYLHKELMQRNPSSTKMIVEILCQLLDVVLSQAKIDMIALRLDKEGGMDILKDERWAQGKIWNFIELIVLAPEYHTC